MKTGLVAVVLMLSGCAALQGATMHDGAPAGHWNGSVQRDGWARGLEVDVPSGGGAWRARWSSSPSGVPVKDLEVQGQQISFTIDDMRFVGELSTDRLMGTIAPADGGTPAGDFSLSLEEFPPGF